MPVKLTDKVFTEAGLPVSGAVVQAYRTNGTTGTVVATDTTDANGVWAFDSSIAGHQADLADPAAGEYYDAIITVGLQRRIRYGAIKAMMSMVYLAQTIMLGATQILDTSVARLRVPVKAADPGSPGLGEFEFRSDTKNLRVYDGTTWYDIGDVPPEDLYSGALTVQSANYTVPLASNVMFVWCQAAITVTLTSGANRPITVRMNVAGNATVVATAGSVIGGSAHPTTGAIQNGIVSAGEAFTYKWDGNNWGAC